MGARRVIVTFEDYNEEVLRVGLGKLGLDFDEISDEQLGKMLSYALGFVDYTDESVVKDMIEMSGDI